MATSKRALLTERPCVICSEMLPANSAHFSHHFDDDGHLYQFTCRQCIDQDDLFPENGKWVPKPHSIITAFTLILINDPSVPNRHCKDCGYLYPWTLMYFTWRKEDKEGERKVHVYCKRCHGKYRKQYRTYIRKLQAAGSELFLAKYPDSDYGLRMYWKICPEQRPLRWEPPEALKADQRVLQDF